MSGVFTPYDLTYQYTSIFNYGFTQQRQSKYFGFREGIKGTSTVKPGYKGKAIKA